MAIRDILKMGDARLLRVARPVEAFDSDALHALVRDMVDTMRAANGAGRKLSIVGAPPALLSLAALYDVDAILPLAR